MKRLGSVLGGVVLAVSGVAALSAQGVFPPPPQAFGSIVRQPPQESSFTLDRSMLGATDAFFNGNPDGRRIAAGLNSITFTNFHYRDFASYDGSAFGALNAAYEAAGFHHLVNANANSRAPMLTDLWLRTNGTMVTNVVVLTRGDRNMNAISVDCNLRPLDLLHLSGHFGIPQVDANAVMVPAPPPGYAPAPGSVPNVATGPITPAPNQPTSNQPAPELHHHTQNDPQ